MGRRVEDDRLPYAGLAAIAAVLVLVTLGALRFGIGRWRATPEATLETAGAAAEPPPVVRRKRTNVAAQRPAVSSATVDGGALSTLSPGAVTAWFKLAELMRRDATETAANVNRYCAETAKLPKHVFADSPSTAPDRDAAYFLEPLVTWETKPRSVGLLQLPKGTIDKIRAAHDDWPTALSAADASGIDFGWLAQLSAFDHWSLATVGAVADQAATVDPFNQPIPYYPPLVDYAKLRFVRGLAEGDVATALSEVQHLADLVHTNGIYIAEIHAAWIVRLEQQVLAAAAQQGIPTSDLSAPLDAASEGELHDLTLAGTAFFFPGVDPAVSKQALACAPDPCGAIVEGISMHREMDRLTGAEDGFWALAGATDCDQAMLDLMKTSPPP